MSVLLLAVGVLLVVLPGALMSLGARLAPSEWCRAVLVCLRVGRFAIRAGLALAALPLALGALGAHHVAHICHQSFTAGLPVPTQAGWAAAAALVWTVVRSARADRHNAVVLGQLRVEPWLGRHREEDDVEVVTLPCSEHLAYAVPGRPDQVVVSDGLLGALEEDEAEAVLRHERAHLRHHHHRALATAADLEAWLDWFPPARRSAATLRLAVERWADEEAGSASPEARPAVRRALLKVLALTLGPAPAFTDAGTIAARLDALAATPPAPSIRVRLAATLPLLGLSALVVGVVAGCIAVAHHGVDGIVGHCPF